jgi:hypothetical protein
LEGDVDDGDDAVMNQVRLVFPRICPISQSPRRNPGTVIAGSLGQRRPRYAHECDAS